MNFADVKSWTIPEGEVTKVVDSHNRVIWEKQSGPDYSIPFYLFNNTNNTLTFNWKPGDMCINSETVNISYSFDNSTYTTTSVQGSTSFIISVPANTKCYLKADMLFEKVYPGAFRWSSEIGGNIASLLYGNNFTGNETFYPTFYNDLYEENFNYERICAYMFSESAITDASNLVLLHDNPSLNGSIGCHEYMFSKCTSLVSAPILPTILTNSCYEHMFEDCTSLTQAPSLPATTLTDECYHFMFTGCTSLTQAPSLPATTLAYGCYAGMFKGCTSLTQAPALPATTLAGSCYNSMFNDCTSLTQVPSLPATTLAYGCYRGMFDGCTSLAQAPALPATTLVENCYHRMFIDCTSLANVKCLATDISATDCTYYWLSNVSSTGTFTKAAGITWPRSISGIPSSWTVVEQ